MEFQCEVKTVFNYLTLNCLVLCRFANLCRWTLSINQSINQSTNDLSFKMATSSVKNSNTETFLNTAKLIETKRYRRVPNEVLSKLVRIHYRK